MTRNWNATSPTRPRGRAYDPWVHAQDLGIEVVVRPLRSAHGLWIAERRTILVHSRLRIGAQRCALAHELGHAEHAHPDHRPKFEWQADRFAASNLICPDELDDLYKWCPDEQRLVAELGVTSRLLKAYLAA